MTENRLTPTQASALEKIRAKGVWCAYNGISRATIRSLSRAGLVTVEWHTHTWTNYRSKRTHHQLEWTARPVAPTDSLEWDGRWDRAEAGCHVRIGSDGQTELCRIVKEPLTLAGGMCGPDRWTAWIYPRGNQGWAEKRDGFKTLREAKHVAEAAYRREIEWLDSQQQTA